MGPFTLILAFTKKQLITEVIVDFVCH